MGRKALIESENVEKSARSVSHEHFFEIFKLLQQPTIKSRLCPLGKGFFCAQLPSLILILCNIFLNIQRNGYIRATSCSYRAQRSYIQNDAHLSLPASTGWVALSFLVRRCWLAHTPFPSSSTPPSPPFDTLFSPDSPVTPIIHVTPLIHLCYTPVTPTSGRNMEWDSLNFSRWIFIKLADDDV